MYHNVYQRRVEHRRMIHRYTSSMHRLIHAIHTRYKHIHSPSISVYQYRDTRRDTGAIQRLIHMIHINTVSAHTRLRIQHQYSTNTRDTALIHAYFPYFPYLGLLAGTDSGSAWVLRLALLPRPSSSFSSSSCLCCFATPPQPHEPADITTPRDLHIEIYRVRASSFGDWAGLW